MNVEHSFSDRIIRLFPYLLILVALAGIGLTVYLRRLDMAGMSMTLIIPILAVAGILLRRRNKDSVVSSTAFVSRISFPNQVLLYVLVLAISIILLLLNAERPLAYFIVVAIAAGVIFIQIISERSPWTDYLIIFEIVLLSLNLLWGTGLKYPLYFGGTDIMVHLNFIETIMDTGHFSGIGEQYRNFPGYQVLIAIGSEITGIPARYAAFIIMGLAWQAAIVFAYLIFQRFSNSSRIALAACLIFAVNEAAVYYGTYAVARSLEYVLFLGWFLVALNLFKKDIKFIPVLLIFTIAMVMTHHMTIILLTPILVLFYLCQKLFFGFRGENPLLPSVPIILLEVAFIAYFVWVSSGLFSSLLPPYLESFFSTETSMAVDPGELAGSPLSFIFNSAYYGLILIFALFGVYTAWNSGEESSTRNILRTLSLAALLLLILFLPYPLGLLPQARITLSERFPLLVLPFVAIIIAYGIFYLIGMERKGSTESGSAARLPLWTVGLVLVVTFFSVITGINSRDTSYLPNSTRAPTTYFTASEMDSFAFMNQKGNPGLVLYSDYFTVRNLYQLNSFSSRHVLKDGDISYIDSGYIVLRIEELNKKGGLSFSSLGNTLETYRYQRDPFDPEHDIIENTKTGNCIYNNAAVKSFIILE